MPEEDGVENLEANMFATIIEHVTSFAQGISPLPLQEFIGQTEHELELMDRLDGGEQVNEERTKTREKLALYRDLAKASLDYQKAVNEILPVDTKSAIAEGWEAAVTTHKSEIEMRRQANAPGSTKVQ